jgi:hypothetical protein
MRTIPRALGIGLTISALACNRHAEPVTPEPAAGLTDGFDANVRRDVETLRAATNKYHDLAAAEAAGYPTTMPKCIADSTMGGMGHHLIDRKAVDHKLEIQHPEMLIYATDGEGKPELAAVEYIVPYRVLPRPRSRPASSGRSSSATTSTTTGNSTSGRGAGTRLVSSPTGIRR